MICIGMIKVIKEFLLNPEKENTCKTSKNDNELALSILGVTKNSCIRDVKKAYIVLIKEHHPDNFPKANFYIKSEMEEKSKLINWAYSELKKSVA